MLTKSDKAKILEIIKKGKYDARVINRAHTLNMRSKGATAAEVAFFLEITPKTVYNIEDNYFYDGFKKALYDDPPPGTPPKFDESIKSQIVTMVCSEAPEYFDRWTLDLIVEIAQKEGIVSNISKSTVSIILREHDLKPWKQASWCIPKVDDDYRDKMYDVLKVYERPLDSSHPVVCIDEKLYQLTEDIRPPQGHLPGRLKKVDYEYKRRGTANIFCAVLSKEGVYINRVTERRTKSDFAKFLASIERRLSDAEKILLVLDNLNTHNESSLINFYGKDEGRRIWGRFEVHYTPIHGSWLNQAEIAINMYARQCLGRSRIPTIDLLRKKTKFWNQLVNDRKVMIQWNFTRKKAREKFEFKDQQRE